MDDSNVSAHSYTGATIELRQMDGASLSRIMHPPGQRIEPHRHDWPVLAIYRFGAYREETEERAATFDGPSVIFHPAGSDHADEVGENGLETVSMSFDPAWLSAERALLPKRSWSRSGGPAALAARRLARTWLQPRIGDAEVRDATLSFFRHALAAPTPRRPDWIDEIETAAADLHPAWIARSYRLWRGEGIAETRRRRRVECAVRALRASSEPLAAIAADAGFCDQSHMNRCFKAVIGRTPLEVRREAALLASLC